MIRPPRLAPGDRVAVVAPSGPVPRDAFLAGAAILEARYRLVYTPRLFERSGFLAGSDDARVEELARALADPSLRALFCARGGYGLTRILSRLDAAAFARSPKLLVGFSDVTALLGWAARAGVQAVHGPVVTQLGQLAVADQEALFTLVESDAPPPLLSGLTRLHGSGRAEGRLFGGNLEVLSRLVGTPALPPLRGAVLLLEEVGERPYRIDRALTHLSVSGALDGLGGVLLGDFHRCDEPEMPVPVEVAVERLAPHGIPILGGAPVGHAGRNRALPLGARVTLDAQAGTLTFHDPAVA